ncbi:hypothetical protein C8F04DRAFT_1236344 [Mycena alexandri]|uniref:Secreted protein n=1 Tax=Mycena alexandri TaxID=1745969 RepID=A0AAD6SMY2_9AGAR|nr:hypothetical protein C8F04DRAFT_1236344 [Mycena alexandri]
MVKNGLLTCIFLVLQGLFCTQKFAPSGSFVFLLVVPHLVGGDGQERPTGCISLACKDCFVPRCMTLILLFSLPWENTNPMFCMVMAKNSLLAHIFCTEQGMSTLNQLLLCFHPVVITC